ncbi:metal ABC transporter permease [Jannaschia aquimarina]|uniref:MntB_1 protein n=1 Tax=Jannaschia aquimarina TaxID=935700 RepID=A0A0D1EMC0_9RHOB|nr:metal ABC transporter permease [Jannaschia aquimarina]KIT16815.1 Manganese transport system membrane protein MntB [Jannaschia aquimarina]SNT13673.1 manganese/iron transport system permease protein [Jannaschia aquimarina]
MILLEPFSYDYMLNAIWVSALVGATCAFLSAFLTLKGWSLIGDALSHSVIPGVAGAYMLGLPFALGAFLSGGLAAAAMLLLTERSGLKTDTVIGVIFTAFFGLGLFMASLSPAPIDLQSIVLGNILAITPSDRWQVVIIAAVTLAVLTLKWRDFLAVSFDPAHARAVGLNPRLWNAILFTLLAASTVAAMQTVGAFLVIALVVTPGATAYLLTDRFGTMIALSVGLGAGTCALGAYLSYFLDGATGGVIVILQTLVFGAAFLLAPTHGLRARRG